MRNEPLFHSFGDFAVYIAIMGALFVILYYWDRNVDKRFFKLWQEETPAKFKVNARISTRIGTIFLFSISFLLGYDAYFNEHNSKFFIYVGMFYSLLFFVLSVLSLLDDLQFIEIEDNKCTIRNTRLQTYLLNIDEIIMVRFYTTRRSSKSAPYIEIIDKNGKKLIWGLSISLEHYVYLLKFFSIRGVKVEDEFGIFKGWFEKPVEK